MIPYQFLRFAVVALLLGMHPIIAECCSCRYITFDEQMEFADVVLIGKVIARDIRTPPNAREYYSDDLLAFHRVVLVKLYKGSVIGDSITIQSGADGASCGKTLVPGESYVIYANFRVDYTDRNHPVKTTDLSTSLCTRTRLSADTAEVALLEAYAASKR